MNYVEERTETCKHCPICNLDVWLCSGSLYLNPTNNQISTTPKEGFIKGCGCVLAQKIPNRTKKCPAGKW